MAKYIKLDNTTDAVVITVTIPKGKLRAFMQESVERIEDAIDTMGKTAADNAARRVARETARKQARAQRRDARRQRRADRRVIVVPSVSAPAAVDVTPA